jgi:hypothetical protein
MKIIQLSLVTCIPRFKASDYPFGIFKLFSFIYLMYISAILPLHAVPYWNYIQWNLSNPTHQGTKEMCRIVQDVGKLRFSFWLTAIFTNLTWGRNYVGKFK